MNEQTAQRVKEIKQAFRPLMDGVAAASMRQKGLNYHVNWGAKLTDLQALAKEYGKDYEVAVELWKENVRECKIMALLLMPRERMIPEITQLWAETLSTVEMAELAPFFLFQYLDYIPLMAYEWIAGDDRLIQTAGYMTLAGLFSQGKLPDERGLNELLDQALTAMREDNVSVRRAALACLNKLAAAGDLYEQAVDNALKTL